MGRGFKVTEGVHAKRQVDRVIDLTPADRFRRLVSFIADGIVVVDTVGKVRFVNPAAEDLLGKRGRDLIGREFGFPIVLAAATEIEVARPNGSSPTIIEVQSAEIEWDGEPAVVASLCDVTERANVVGQQNEVIEQLRELDELKTEFVTMVSHDMRSPMAAISGFASTLRLNWDAFDDEHRIKILERIGRSAEQLGRFVENVLQFSQIESGKLTYDIREVDLAALVHRVAAENARMASPGAPPTIAVQVPDDLPMVRADEIRQWQILTNLVTNGLKFSPRDEPVEIEVVRDGDRAMVSVRDSGIGIAHDDLGKLFKKFSRLDQPDGMSVPGTGLGLYICKAMIQAQGGDIWVESAPGRGTTFTYSVPLAA